MSDTSLPEPLLAVVRVLPEPTLLLTASGRIVFANPPAAKALGLERERPEALQLTELTSDPPDVVGAYVRMCARTTDLLPGAFRGPHDTAYLCKAALIARKTENRPALVFLRFWPREAETNPFLLLNKKLAELTDEVKRRRGAEEALLRSEAALLERAREAETANRIKDEFLASLSHELRTPLNAILGWTSLLRSGQVPEERRQRALETIEKSARAQARLIEELLDVSRIITNKLRLNLRPIDPLQIVEAALESVRPSAEAKGIRLDAALDANAGAVGGDPDRLQQVFWNLLSNSVKFTPQGGRVRVVLSSCDSSLELSVTDTGQGIRADFLPYVFDRFRQEEGGISRRHGGLGIGLAIAKTVVDLHGGTISAHSEGEGKGATMVVRLPRSPARPATGSEPPSASFVPGSREPEGAKGVEGLRVLVVDDEPDVLELLVVVLQQRGARVETACSTSEALDLLRRTRPDVLVSDIGMPGEDGYVLIRKLREWPEGMGGQTPAVALTAYARAEDRTRALIAGFHAHVPKPVEQEELVRVIATLVTKASPSQSLA